MIVNSTHQSSVKRGVSNRLVLAATQPSAGVDSGDAPCQWTVSSGCQSSKPFQPNRVLVKQRDSCGLKNLMATREQYLRTSCTSLLPE